MLCPGSPYIHTRTRLQPTVFSRKNPLRSSTDSYRSKQTVDSSRNSSKTSSQSKSYSSWPNGNPKSVLVSLKSEITCVGLFQKKTKEKYNYSIEREIAAASGEWVNEFIPNNGKRKTSAKLYVPSTAELLKRNIKRSWTISNPSGTSGPLITPRGGPDAHYPTGPTGPPQSHLSEPGTAQRPVIVAQIPPPSNQRMARPLPLGLAPSYNQQVKRNAPVRSQSMGVADVGRFYMKGQGLVGPPPRFRPPPPPGEGRQSRPFVTRRNNQNLEYADTSSDGEEGGYNHNYHDTAIVPDYRSLDRRKTNHHFGTITQNQKYKTLEPRSKSGNDAHSAERLSQNSRRVLPDIPSNSLPRPGKRTQSDSRSKEYRSQEKRSQSHEDGIEDPSKRRLQLDRDFREPTPDYDTSPPPSECNNRLTGRRNSDSGLLGVVEKEVGGVNGVSVRRHASSVEQRGVNGIKRTIASESSQDVIQDFDVDDNKKGSVSAQHKVTDPQIMGSKSKNYGKNPSVNSGGQALINSNSKKKAQKLSSITRINNDLKSKHLAPSNRSFDIVRDGAQSANSMNFSDLESTRIDFEDAINTTQNNLLESDNNSDIIINEKKIVPESSKFKIVFISSESKSGSELNSSLEYSDPCKLENNEDHLKNVKADFIEEMDWENYRKNTKRNIPVSHQNTHQSPIVPMKNGKYLNTPQNTGNLDHINHDSGDDFGYVSSFLNDNKNRHPSGSPSIRTIMTSATKDSNSIPASPHIPKIHNIHIKHELAYENNSPKPSPRQYRPRSAQSTTTICSETSQDLEVQNILGGSKFGRQRGQSSSSHNESQEIMIDFDTSVNSTANNSFDLSTSADMTDLLNGMKSGPIIKNIKKPLIEVHPTSIQNHKQLRTESTRSSAERSMDEMSLYDQMCLQKIQRKPLNKKDPRVEEYRNLVLAEIKSMKTENNGILARSLSESDLSEIGGAGSPTISLEEEERSTATPSDKELLNYASGTTSQTSPEMALVVAVTSPTNSDLTSSTGSVKSSKTLSVGTSSTLSQGSKTQSPGGMKHGRLELCLSNTSGCSNSPPPPVLPPKTRKLQQQSAEVPRTSGELPGEDSLGVSQKQQTAAATSTAVSAQVARAASSVTKRQLGEQQSTGYNNRLQETFVDDGVSIVRIGQQQSSGLNRSASSVTAGSQVKHTITKPVRRSKSQLPGSKFVTNITHGGSVTLVSLNDERQHQPATNREFVPIEPGTFVGVDRGPGFHKGRTIVPAFQGSNTLPRAGQKNKIVGGGKFGPGATTVDDSEIVITKKLTGGGSSVRIRIGGAARSPTEQVDVASDNWRDPARKVSDACCETEQDTHKPGSSPASGISPFETKVVSSSGSSRVSDTGSAKGSIAGKPGKQAKQRSSQLSQPAINIPQSIAESTRRQLGANEEGRKYSLDEIEVDTFSGTGGGEKKDFPHNEGDADETLQDSDFDLNSLIEGDVDDDDFGENFDTSVKDQEDPSTPVVTYFEPLKDPEASVDGVLSEAEFSEEELGSLAVNVGSLHQRSSDTEADFLDKDEFRRDALKRANEEYKSNIADDEHSICSDIDHVRDKKTLKVDRDRPRTQKSTNDSDSDHQGQNEEKSQVNDPSVQTSKSNPHLNSSFSPNEDKLPSFDQFHLANLAETTETSDFDSVSTTSASYVVSHSDIESLSLDDHQLDLLMAKSDLSDIDQIDSKTITGSGSSDEDSNNQISGIPKYNAAVTLEDTFIMDKQRAGLAFQQNMYHPISTGSDPTEQQGVLCTDQHARCEGQDLVEEGAAVRPSRSCQVSATQAGLSVAGAQDIGSARPVGQENCEGLHTVTDSGATEHCSSSADNNVKQYFQPTIEKSDVTKTDCDHTKKSEQRTSKGKQLLSPSYSDPIVREGCSPRLEGQFKGSVGTPELDRQGTNSCQKRKGSVSHLIAKFETSRSNTPERSITPDSRSLRSVSPDKGISTVKPVDSADNTNTVLCAVEIANKLDDVGSIRVESSTGAIPKKNYRNSQEKKPSTNEKLHSAALNQEKSANIQRDSAELKGLKEFTQKYLKEQAAKNAPKRRERNDSNNLDILAGEDCVDAVEIDSDIEDIDGMPPTIRRNSGGGAYTSYVFISSEPSNDEVASVVSSSGSCTDPENRVTVNVKETNASPNTCVVAIQDGRTSNISIVSTESSELNSPRQSPTSIVDEPPELPTKVKVGIGKDHSELQEIVFATRESIRDYSHRSRGGEELDREYLDDEPDHDRSGLANYFTSTLESSFISRRGRPPVIRAAEKVRRQQGNFEYEDESRGMMIDYSDHQPYRESSSTPVLDVDEDMIEAYEEGKEKFKMTEVQHQGEFTPPTSDHYDEYDPQVQYDIQYGSGESGEEYIEREEYPMCRQVYDSEEYSCSEGEQISSGDEFDREEELRGYNRAIDFTLHTIIEESCEDSEPENKSLRAGDRKRHSDPSELEKYFFYGVGGGNMDQNMQEESEFSDTNSDSNSFYNDQIKDVKETTVDSAELASTRIEKYLLTGFSEEKAQSLDAISDQGNTDDSGSVGSESDGTSEQILDPKRKKVTRPRGFRSERLSDRGESGTENVDDESCNIIARQHDISYSSESGEDNTAFLSGDGSFDTIKRKKNKVRKQSDDKRSDSERSVDSRRSSAVSEATFYKQNENASDIGTGHEGHYVIKKDDKSSPKLSSTLIPLPSQTVESKPLSNITDSSLRQKLISPSGSDKEPELTKPHGSGSSKESLSSTSPPPVSGPVRKHKSRDSGFVGSNDDLLRNEGSHIVHTSSDDMQSKQTESSSEGEHDNRQKTRLEKVSEVSENTEDDCEKSVDNETIIIAKKETQGHENAYVPREKSNESDISKDGSETGKLSRKDSFHQWSSDEETNIMMNRMRSFFKNMLVNASKGKPLEPTRKPTQIVYFEERLTRLMKTVPGINDQQVKEIVEYLSSEDTWSDSYDSSDYTDYTSSDLEGASFLNETEDPLIPDMDVEIPEQMSACNQEIIQRFDAKNAPSGSSLDVIAEQDDFQKETAIMYQKLMNSVAKIKQSQEEQMKEKEAKKSPPIAAKILHHISSRLVTLMHEVSGSDNSSTASITDSRQNLYLTSKDFRNQSVTSSPKPKTSHSRRHRQLEATSSNDSMKKSRLTSSGLDADSNKAGRDKLKIMNAGEENENSYTFNSLDSPKVLMGPNLGSSPKSNPFKFTKDTSKSVEVLDLGRRRASLDDKSLKLSMAKSTSTDYDVWEGTHRDVDQRRGSLPRSQLESGQNHSSSSGVSDINGLDDERFSWKGSFESALAADSRTRLSIEAKRRSIGSDIGNSEIFSSVEQMDRSGSHAGSKSSLITSRSPSQSSKRSLKSSLPNSRSSLHISKSEKDITRNCEHSTTPTSELSTKLSTQDSDSDDVAGSISNSVRSSISSRYGRRSSVPETQVLARLSEDSPPSSPKLEKANSSQPSSTTSIMISGMSSTSASKQHSTNSLPRLGTSAIQKSKSTSTTLIYTTTSSLAPSQPSNIATSTQGGVRSARYRPHGYKPPPSRKMSPASGGPSRKSSVDSLVGRFPDDVSEISSKSGTPSPMVSRVGGYSSANASRSTSDLLTNRDHREPSVCSRGSSGADIAELDERDSGTIDKAVGNLPMTKAGSFSSLGTRSESMASVYSQGEGRYGTVAVRGDVEFGFIYNFGSGSLDISIRQCRDLAPVDLKRNRSDPYVKVYLLPDRSKAGKRKTKVKKHTLNPLFEEILKFVMPLNEVERRTMWISVWHSDMFGRNDFLGEVMMPLSGQVFDDPSSKWYSLQDRTEPPEDESVINSRGDIIVALKYVPSESSGKHTINKNRRGTLMILVKEAKNLPVPKGTQLPDPYCKCSLLPNHTVKGKQKTGICRRTTSPRWEQTFSWDDLGLEEVSDRCLEVAIWDHDRIGHQDFLGGARFNLGSGKHSGRPAFWMDGLGKEVTLWQQMLDRPNFWVEGSVPLRVVLETSKPEK